MRIVEERQPTSESTGWFRTSRELFVHRIADDRPWCRGFAWLYLIAVAAHDDHTLVLRHHEYVLKRGRLAISLSDFASKTGWTKKKVRIFLVYLHDCGMIQLYTDYAGTFVKIVNYDRWQGIAHGTANGIADESPEETEGNDEGTANGTPEGTPSEEKSPHTPLKKKGMRSSTKDSPPTPSKRTTPLLTFDETTQKVIGITPAARAKFNQAFPTADLDFCMEKMRVWIIGRSNPHKTYWKTLCTFAGDEKENHAKNRVLLNAGPMAGQSVKVGNSGEVQQNKRPVPVMDITGFVKGG